MCSRPLCRVSFQPRCPHRPFLSSTLNYLQFTEPNSSYLSGLYAFAKASSCAWDSHLISLLDSSSFLRLPWVSPWARYSQSSVSLEYGVWHCYHRRVPDLCMTSRSRSLRPVSLLRAETRDLASPKQSISLVHGCAHVILSSLLNTGQKPRNWNRIFTQEGGPFGGHTDTLSRSITISAPPHKCNFASGGLV